jgi:hypothetical protein
MFANGFLFCLGAVGALVLLWCALKILDPVLAAILDGLYATFERVGKVSAKRYDVPKPTWFRRLPDGLQLIMTAFGAIGVWFGCCAAARVIMGVL